MTSGEPRANPGDRSGQTRTLVTGVRRYTRRMRDFNVTVPIEVTFRDVDAMGHVNNAVYLTWFECGRIGYWKAIVGDDVPPDLLAALRSVDGEQAKILPPMLLPKPTQTRAKGIGADFPA